MGRRERAKLEAAGRGRPRDPAIDASILEAALDLLAEGGYSRATIDAVAARAGLQRPAVYRRYPTRAALVAAAVAGGLSAANPAPPSTDDAARDLVTILRNLVRQLTSTRLGPAIKGLVSHLDHDPELRAASDGLQSERRIILRTVLRRMRASGALRPGLDVEMAIDVLLGAVYFRLLLGDGVYPRGFERELCALVTTTPR